MIKVMLVDDEHLIRQGLRVITDWEAYGYEIAAEAANGSEALDLIKKVNIDLAIVDLNMPIMGGLELIRIIKNSGKYNMRFVILTGYAEFKYARAAMNLHVNDYLLKPIQKQELMQLLERTNKEYKQSLKKRQEEKKRLQIEYQQRATNVLFNKYTEEDLYYIREKMMPGAWWNYVSFEFDENDENFLSLSNCEKAGLQKECVDRLEELMKKDYFHIIPSADMEGHVFGAGLLYSPGLSKFTNREGRDYIACIHKKLSECFVYKLQVYIGSKVDRLEQISDSFQAVRIARCFHNLGNQKKTIVCYEELKRNKALYGIRKADMEKLLASIKSNDRKLIPEMVGRVYSQIKNNALTLETVKANIYYLYYYLLELSKEFDSELEQMEVLQYITQESFDQLVLSGNERELVQFILNYANYLNDVRNESRKGIPDKIKEYVNKHFHENLSLKMLGEKFFINNVYLGQLFKKKYGISFKEYLNNLRIEEATRLLETTDLRIYAIAEKAGFQNVDYFINKFVQIKGSTPNQYRRIIKLHKKKNIEN